MNHLEYFAAARGPVETCVVGSGGFGRSFIAQGLRVPLMRCRVAVDRDIAIAAAGFADLGVAAADIAACKTADAARQAWSEGKFIAADDLATVVKLPIDVVVEATGNPEAGARHGRLAIEAGRHAFLSGRIPRKRFASASSPVDGLIG